jgi:hypothetical protein
VIAVLTANAASFSVYASGQSSTLSSTGASFTGAAEDGEIVGENAGLKVGLTVGLLVGKLTHSVCAAPPAVHMPAAQSWHKWYAALF